MATVYDVLDQLHNAAKNTRDQGDLFERLMVAFLRTDPQYSQLFSEVWLWMDWPGRNGRPDTGIDIVAEQEDTGDVWAIQCKFYKDNIMKEDLDSFYTESGKKPFTKRLVVATAPLSKHAQEAMDGQWIDVHTLTLEQLNQSPIDWSKFIWAKPAELSLRAPKDPLPHQEKAIRKVISGFKTSDRGKLIMACGSGKTFTGLQVAEAMVPSGGYVLVLTPSIALVSQTLREWTAEARRQIRAYAVCSDVRVGKDDEDLRPSDLAIPPTTDPRRLSEGCSQKSTPSGGVTVIFSTYQSIQVISEAQKKCGLPAMDLIIADEAHRTVGTDQMTTKSRVQSHYTQVHEDKFVQARKRLYMTATPRIYGEDSKKRATKHSITLYSMDDNAVYGPEFHRLSFSEAVEGGILSDYKVLILTVDESEALELFGDDIHDQNKLEAKLDDEAKIIGCINAFAKRFPKEDDDDIDDTPMRRVVAFTNKIVDSKRVVNLFKATAEASNGIFQGTRYQAEHVDGSMNIANRNAALTRLRYLQDPDECHIVSNARCLTEGIDVPALDAVVFLQPRDSQVDVVQAVGRVMRRAPGKKFGYVILPVVIPSDSSPEEALEDTKAYKVVWQVLNALRSHDDHFNDIINHLEFNQRSRKVRVIGKGSQRDSQQLPLFNVEQLQKAFYAKIVKKVGDREYWDEWARKVAKIADRYQVHIHDILRRDDDKSKAAQMAFTEFMAGLHENVNDQIPKEEAVEMLAQHLVTKPIFDALFDGYVFTVSNPVARSMQQVIDQLEAKALWKEKESVDKAEASLLETIQSEVQRKASGIESAEGKQKLVIKIYDKFFRVALKKTANRLGIVYTPVEVVDFILHSVERVLAHEFGNSLTAESVHILDPFTGTGTFMVRLLQSGLIRPTDLIRKYRFELHANEVVLLAYYIAAINIEETFHRLSGKDYESFPGIVLTDTFQQGESRKNFFGTESLPENNERLHRQNSSEIRVIVGNPPYSGGQDRENDNNKNLVYPELDKRISETYTTASVAQSNNKSRDSYIRAIRWASDRIGTQGVIGFVTNGMFIDSTSSDGLRKCLAGEFSTVYVYNLRGDQLHTVGEESRREGGKIFDSGSRQPIAITVLVKNPAKNRSVADIYYHDIGDYLSRDEKLKRIRDAHDIFGLKWGEPITPNDAGDWVNQRTDVFQSLVPLGDRKFVGGQTIFDVYSLGVATNRDAWAHNFSLDVLEQNMTSMISEFNNQVAKFEKLDAASNDIDTVESVIDYDDKRISWSANLKKDVAKLKRSSLDKDHIFISMYRPFCKQGLYFDRQFNERVYQMPKLFPDRSADNLLIQVSGKGGKKDFSCLITDVVADLNAMDAGAQCFPLYYYDEAQLQESGFQTELFEGVELQSKWVRREAITDWAFAQFRERYGPSVSKEDIFYYVYGILHSPDYRGAFSSDLKKMLPRVPFVQTGELFTCFSQAGRELARWHLNYEAVDAWPLNEEVSTGASKDLTQTYRVQKMKFGRGEHGQSDKSVLHYNEWITLSGIPLETYEYVVSGRPALEWIIDRYQVREDTNSGIANDPNTWSSDPTYIVSLVKQVVRVSMETQRIVKSLPKLDWA